MLDRRQKICLMIFIIGMCLMFGSMKYNGSQKYNTYTGLQKCRISGCNKTARYSDWGRSFCSTHLSGNKKCHFGSCNNMLPRTSQEIYCASCKAYNK